jgi:O-antigen ligase
LLLSVAALALLGLSYLGVIFLPGRSIHQVTDLLEPQLAGDWRGVFGHKNDASAVFSLITFIGLFAIRGGRPLLGSFVFGLAFFFLIMTAGKSSTALCIMVIAVTLTAQRIRSPWLWSIVVLAPLVALNAIGVGAVVSPTLASIAHMLPLDTSFTGRTEIWQYAIDKIDERRWLGHGFFAFWNTDAVRYGNGDDTTVWAGNAAHAHNGYLDAALAMGYPGLIVTLVALVAQPARDFRAAVIAGADPALTLMLFQIWLFGLYLSSLESFFYDRSNAIWVTFLFAIFGLRYLARFRSRP